jgi:hypothetical protein
LEPQGIVVQELTKTVQMETWSNKQYREKLEYKV